MSCTSDPNLICPEDAIAALEALLSGRHGNVIELTGNLESNFKTAIAQYPQGISHDELNGLVSSLANEYSYAIENNLGHNPTTFNQAFFNEIQEITSLPSGNSTPTDSAASEEIVVYISPDVTVPFHAAFTLVDYSQNGGVLPYGLTSDEVSAIKYLIGNRFGDLTTVSLTEFLGYLAQVMEAVLTMPDRQPVMPDGSTVEPLYREDIEKTIVDATLHLNAQEGLGLTDAQIGYSYDSMFPQGHPSQFTSPGFGTSTSLGFDAHSFDAGAYLKFIMALPAEHQRHFMEMLWEGQDSERAILRDEIMAILDMDGNGLSNLEGFQDLSPDILLSMDLDLLKEILREAGIDVEEALASIGLPEYYWEIADKLKNLDLQSFKGQLDILASMIDEIPLSIMIGKEEISIEAERNHFVSYHQQMSEWYRGMLYFQSRFEQDVPDFKDEYASLFAPPEEGIHPLVQLAINAFNIPGELAQGFTELLGGDGASAEEMIDKLVAGYLTWNPNLPLVVDGIPGIVGSIEDFGNSEIGEFVREHRETLLNAAFIGMMLVPIAGTLTWAAAFQTLRGVVYVSVATGAISVAAGGSFQAGAQFGAELALSYYVGRGYGTLIQQAGLSGGSAFLAGAGADIMWGAGMDMLLRDDPLYQALAFNMLGFGVGGAMGYAGAPLIRSGADLWRALGNSRMYAFAPEFQTFNDLINTLRNQGRNTSASIIQQDLDNLPAIMLPMLRGGTGNSIIDPLYPLTHVPLNRILYRGNAIANTNGIYSNFVIQRSRELMKVGLEEQAAVNQALEEANRLLSTLQSSGYSPSIVASLVATDSSYLANYNLEAVQEMFEYENLSVPGNLIDIGEGPWGSLGLPTTQLIPVTTKYMGPNGYLHVIELPSSQTVNPLIPAAAGNLEREFIIFNSISAENIIGILPRSALPSELVHRSVNVIMGTNGPIMQLRP